MSLLLFICIIATALFMITDKGTIGEIFIKRKGKQQMFAMVKSDKCHSFILGLVLINMFVAITPCSPSRKIFICGPQADTKDDTEIFSVQFLPDKRLANDRSRLAFRLIHDKKRKLILCLV